MPDNRGLFEEDGPDTLEGTFGVMAAVDTQSMDSLVGGRSIGHTSGSYTDSYMESAELGEGGARLGNDDAERGKEGSRGATALKKGKIPSGIWHLSWVTVLLCVLFGALAMRAKHTASLGRIGSREGLPEEEEPTPSRIPPAVVPEERNLIPRYHVLPGEEILLPPNQVFPDELRLVPAAGDLDGLTDDDVRLVQDLKVQLEDAVKREDIPHDIKQLVAQLPDFLRGRYPGPSRFIGQVLRGRNWAESRRDDYRKLLSELRSRQPRKEYKIRLRDLFRVVRHQHGVNEHRVEQALKDIQAGSFCDPTHQRYWKQILKEFGVYDKAVDTAPIAQHLHYENSLRVSTGNVNEGAPSQSNIDSERNYVRERRHELSEILRKNPLVLPYGSYQALLWKELDHL